jgi:dihydroneopterin aldolase
MAGTDQPPYHVDAMDRMPLDKVVIEKLVVRANVGVTEAERAAAQRLRVDLELVADLKSAGEADDLARTIDYGSVVEVVREVAAVTSPKLLETLAEKIAAAIFERFGPAPGRKPGEPGVVCALRLRVVKLDPPLDVAVDAVGVEIERHPVRRPPGAPERAGFR